MNHRGHRGTQGKQERPTLVSPCVPCGYMLLRRSESGDESSRNEEARPRTSRARPSTAPRSQSRPGAPPPRGTHRSYLYEHSVRIVSPRSKSIGVSATCTRCAIVDSRCISIRLAASLKCARCRNVSRSKFASSSRFSRVSRFRLNAAVTPAASLYAVAQQAHILPTVDAEDERTPRAHRGTNPMQERRRFRRVQVADRRAREERHASRVGGRLGKRESRSCNRRAPAPRAGADTGARAPQQPPRAAPSRCRPARTPPDSAAGRAATAPSRRRRSRTRSARCARHNARRSPARAGAGSPAPFASGSTRAARRSPRTTARRRDRRTASAEGSSDRRAGRAGPPRGWLSGASIRPDPEASSICKPRGVMRRSRAGCR